MHILIALLLHVSALAHTEAELEHRKATLAKINIAFGEADAGVLPACAGLDHTAETALRIEPARDCTRAQEYYTHVLKLDRELRDACRELERFMESTLRAPTYCARREEPGWLMGEQEKLTQLRSRASDLVMDPAANLDDIEHLFEEGEAGRGEMARMSCSLPVTIGMQFRKKQLALINKHFGHASAALSDSCSSQREPGEEFFRYMREGY